MPEKTSKPRSPGTATADQTTADQTKVSTSDQPNQPKPSISDERGAMRIYLQRAEVRLSTMHRVAGIFLNGAGLLILFPLLFKDVVQNIMIILATKTTFSMASIPYLFLVIPFVISLIVPLRSLYLLLKDLVDFYFAGNFPGYSLDSPIPRFVVPACVLPSDEASSLKNEVLKVQYSSDDPKTSKFTLRKFVLPFDEEATEYYDKLIKDSVGVIPETRTMPYLQEKGVVNHSSDNQEKERFSVIFGLSGAYDRDLVEEVAFTEAMLARHASSLRRLVLRYAKALLVVVWTILASFFIVALVHAIEDKSSNWITVIGPNLTMSFVAVLYFIWAAVTFFLVKRPIQWIFEMTHFKRPNTLFFEGGGAIVTEPQLKKFEAEVERWVVGSMGSSIIFLVWNHFS